MAKSDLEILDELTHAILKIIPTAFGEGVELDSLSPKRIDRRYSFMFSYRIRGPRKEIHSLLVKIPHESWMSTMQEAMDSEHLREVVCGEFKGLASIADAISQAGKPGLFAIRPKAFFPEFNALLIEKISIRMLKTFLSMPAIMMGTTKGWQAFEIYLNLAGEWLKVIHGCFASKRVGTLKSLAMEEKLEAELKSIEGCLGHPLKSLRSNFQLLVDSIKEEAVPLSGLHNDYQLGNIFVTDGGNVGALDPNWVEEGATFRDLATLLIDPATRRAQVLFQRILFRPSLEKRYEQAILKGYFGDSGYASSLLDFYCALAILIKWREDEELLKSGSSKCYTAGTFVIRLLMRGYFQRLLKRYLSQGLETINTQRQAGR